MLHESEPVVRHDHFTLEWRAREQRVQPRDVLRVLGPWRLAPAAQPPTRPLPDAPRFLGRRIERGSADAPLERARRRPFEQAAVDEPGEKLLPATQQLDGDSLRPVRRVEEVDRGVIAYAKKGTLEHGHGSEV